MELFCVLGNGNLEKIPYIFSKESFSYISGNRNPPKIIYISGNGNPKKILIYQETELSSSKLKNISYVSGENLQSSKYKNFLTSSLIKKQIFLNYNKAFLLIL